MTAGPRRSGGTSCRRTASAPAGRSSGGSCRRGCCGRAGTPAHPPARGCASPRGPGPRTCRRPRRGGGGTGRFRSSPHPGSNSLNLPLRFWTCRPLRFGPAVPVPSKPLPRLGRGRNHGFSIHTWVRTAPSSLSGFINYN